MTGLCANQIQWLRLLPRVHKLQQLPDIRIICLYLGVVQTGVNPGVSVHSHLSTKGI